MAGFRNVAIIGAYIAFCAWSVYRGDAAHVRDTGAMLSDVGWCVAAMIGARAATKWAERAPSAGGTP